MIKVLSFNILSGKTKVHTTMGKGLDLWHIEIKATNDTETIIVELENQERASMACMQQLVADELTQIIKELSPVTNGGFTVYKRKA